MSLTLADVCLLVGTIAIHWQMGNFFYNKIFQADGKINSEK